MRTWQCFLDLQTRLAYGDHAGVDSPYSVAIQQEVKRVIATASLSGPTLVIGPGGGTERAWARHSLPEPITFLSAHAPDVHEGEVSGDMHDIPLASGSFGLVFANNVLEHALAPYIVLHEVRRVLSLGGHAYFVMPGFEGEEAGVGPFHLHCMARQEWQELMNKTGLALVYGLDQDGGVRARHYLHFLVKAVPVPGVHATVHEALLRHHATGRTERG